MWNCYNVTFFFFFFYPDAHFIQKLEIILVSTNTTRSWWEERKKKLILRRNRHIVLLSGSKSRKSNSAELRRERSEARRSLIELAWFAKIFNKIVETISSRERLLQTVDKLYCATRRELRKAVYKREREKGWKKGWGELNFSSLPATVVIVRRITTLIRVLC